MDKLSAALESNENSGRTKSQQRALNVLKKMLSIQMMGQREVCGITLRTHKLLVGPSGSGKTRLVQDFCREEELPLFSVNAHNWIVMGAKNGDATSSQIARFVQQNNRGMIFIDEINKLTTHHANESAWTSAALSELLALLDSDERLLIMGFCVPDLQKLNRWFLIVGAAAFQDLWMTNQKPMMGFGNGQQNLNDYISKIQKQELVPQELLFRFSDHLLLIESLSQKEFEVRICKLRKELGVSPLSEGELKVLASEAFASGKQMRWLESYLDDLWDKNYSKPVDTSSVNIIQPTTHNARSLNKGAMDDIRCGFIILCSQMERLHHASLQFYAALGQCHSTSNGRECIRHLNSVIKGHADIFAWLELVSLASSEYPLPSNRGEITKDFENVLIERSAFCDKILPTLRQHKHSPALAAAASEFVFRLEQVRSGIRNIHEIGGENSPRPKDFRSLSGNCHL